MKKIKFTVDGHEFVCDAGEMSRYKTAKQLSNAEKDPAGMFDAMGRIFMGKDEEYIELLGGDVDAAVRLANAAAEAADTKK